MCGISGFFAKNSSFQVADVIYKLNQSIKHRGPDGEGFLLFDNQTQVPVFSLETPLQNRGVQNRKYDANKSLGEGNNSFPFAFGHRRLAIIDLSPDGHQPMCDDSGEFWLTFNGEIYNYLELKSELSALGHSFQTKSDSEVLIHAYKQWGEKCVEKFNGMWAFALLDVKKKKVFFARDRVGVKPLYFAQTNDFFAFSSEYKSFIKSKLVKFEVNERAKFDFLMNGNVESSKSSMFEGIYVFPHAHTGEYDLNTHTFSLKPYYAPEIEENRTIHKNEWRDKVEESLERAIAFRMRSDVTIGACLSGGLDSSVLAGFMHKINPNQKVNLFTASFPNESFDETQFAKAVAAKTDASWNCVTPTSAEFFEDLKDLNYFQDVPVWSTSTYAQHRVMKLASENGVKVVLDGQGADELFAGYHHQYLAWWNELLQEGKVLKFLTELEAAGKTIPSPWGFFLKQKFKQSTGFQVSYANMFLPEFRALAKAETYPIFGNLNKQLHYDYFSQKLQAFLKCEDRSSMAFGIESRVPFSDDHELVKLAFTIPAKFKIEKGISKNILREASKHVLPQEVYQRKDKIGFEAPLKKWLLSERKQIFDTLLDLDFIDKKRFPSIFDDLLNRKPAVIFRLYSFAVWKDVFSKF